MKLREYIACLKKILKKEGNLDCYYAIDDEGNGYQRVGYAASVYFTPELEYRLDTVFSNDQSEEEIEDCGYEKSELKKMCMVN